MEQVHNVDSAPHALLTSRDAADILGVGLTKLNELRRSGAFPSVRIGKLRRYRYTDLEAFMDRSTCWGIEEPVVAE